MTEFIPVNEPLLVGNEERYLRECIQTGWISSEGPFVSKFEQEFASRMDRQYGIAVCNGTAALDVAIAALKIAPGDEIILPTFTIISCASAIIRAKAVPVLVDCMPDTWNMDVKEIESKITSRTAAIMVVHIYGLPVDMDPLLRIVQKHGLVLIEDAAEMIGQTYKNRPCGSFGDLSTFSFYPNKHVTTGEGGMVVTNDAALAERCRSLRNLCFQEGKRFVHDELGWNYRMTNMQAALGVAQLERLDESIVHKRWMGRRYTELLSGFRSAQLPLPRTDYSENIYWVYGLVLNKDNPVATDQAMRRLGEKGIGTRPFFWPMHEQPIFRSMGLFSSDAYPVAEHLARRGFYIPSGLAMDEAKMDRVVEVLREIFS